MICRDETRVVRLLGSVPYELVDERALSTGARVAAVRAAASGADVYLTEESAQAMARRYPLQVDALEHAMHLAASGSIFASAAASACSSAASA